MSFDREFKEKREERSGFEWAMKAGTGDAEMEQALNNFRRSVHAWSEVELSRPRRVEMTVQHRSWRLAAGWALGCALIAGSASGYMYERHRQAELGRIRALQDAERQREVAAQKVKDADAELARVDSDVSRDVPSAMEPLAQLMGEDQSQ
jgi:hypothetical protein